MGERLADQVAELEERVAGLEKLAHGLHWHACPHCYDHEPCATTTCTIEPDLVDRDRPHGAHVMCGGCARDKLRYYETTAEDEGGATAVHWMETAAQESRNKDYYRGLLLEIGGLFGDEARTSEDGSMQADVLCAKVPELVRRALKHVQP